MKIKAHSTGFLIKAVVGVIEIRKALKLMINFTSSLHIILLFCQSVEK